MGNSYQYKSENFNKRKNWSNSPKKQGKFGHNWPRLTANFDPADNRADQFMDYNEFDELEPRRVRNRKQKRKSKMEKRR